MSLSVQQLRTPMTEEEALATILSYLQTVGFNTTSWQSGSIQRKFLRYFSYVVADLSQVIAELVDFVFSETATGRALTELSRSHYDNERSAAVRTIGQIRLTNVGASPQTISPSAVVVAYTEADGTQRTYRNVTGGTIAAGGGTVDLTWVAETAGADWNIPVNSVLTLLTSVAGVTASNPAITGSSTWITTAGADQESDEELRARNRTKWSTLSIEVIADGVVALALAAAPNVTRVAVNDTNPRGAGTFDVYLATATGPASVSDLAAVQTALNARFFGSATALALAAPETPLNVTVTVYYTGDYDAATIAGAVDDALTGMIAAVPLGGYDYVGGYDKILPVSEIVNAIRAIELNGAQPVRAVKLTVPAADVNVSSWAAVTRGSWLITCTPVTG